MSNPFRVLVKRDELTLEGIKQFFVAVEKEQWKFDTLCDLSGEIRTAWFLNVPVSLLPLRLT